MEKLPSEIQWKIMKFIRHPMADAFMNAEQVKEALELAKYNTDVNYWSGGEQEQERWRVGFFREFYFDNGKYYMDSVDDGPVPFTRDWYDNPCEYDPGMDPMS